MRIPWRLSLTRRFLRRAWPVAARLRIAAGAVDERSRQRLDAAARFFDAAFYRASGGASTDDSGSARDLFAHFMAAGWREGRSPSRCFDVTFYLATYPDVARSGINPLVHYIEHGQDEGRITCDPAAHSTPADRALAAPHFDEAFYLARRSESLPITDPLGHFLTRGWREGLNPGPDFDVAFYLATNPDVAAAGVNPLVHYLTSGRAEGRLPRKPANAWRATLDAAWARKTLAPARAAIAVGGLSPDQLALRLDWASGNQGLIVAFGQDDYARHCGGVQTVIADEQRTFNAAGWGYLHLSPPTATMLPPLVADVWDERASVSGRLDGHALGHLPLEALITLLDRLAGRARRIQVVVHHLGGHAPEVVARVIRASRTTQPVFWVHDFFSICPGYFLLRNDVSFCGAPPPDSPACQICCHGAERQRHLARVRRLFAGVDAVVLAPSPSALEVWQRCGLPYAAAAIVPLARLTPDVRPDAGGAAGAETAALRIAHIGPALFHKGWHVFEALAHRLRDDRRYQFHHLGVAGVLPAPAHVVHVPVSVGADDRQAMIRALTAHRIDVVLHWSLCHETFSLTAHEALAAGAFLIVRAGSGNVWPAVVAHASDRGCVVADEADLDALFTGPDFAARVRAGHRRFGFAPGGATADWLLPRLDASIGSPVRVRRQHDSRVGAARWRDDG